MGETSIRAAVVGLFVAVTACKQPTPSADAGSWDAGDAQFVVDAGPCGNPASPGCTPAPVPVPCGRVDAGNGTSVHLGGCAEPELCGGGATPNVCSKFCNGAWCWDTPVANLVADVWSPADDLLWTVGEFGTILTWDGVTWSRQQSGVTQRLVSVWGAAVDDIWAVGDQGAMLHFDGHAWAAVTVPVISPMFMRVRGSTSSDVWALAARSLLHWDGTTWSEVYQPAIAELNDLWVSPDGHVWLAGDNGLILDGATLQPIAHGLRSFLSPRLDGSAANNVWLEGAVTENFSQVPFLAHFDGSTWKEVPLVWPTGITQQSALRVLAPDDVWVATTNGYVQHRDGSAFTVVRAPPSSMQMVFAVGGHSSASMWLAGIQPCLMRWDSAQFVPAARYLDLSPMAVAAIAPNSALVLGSTWNASAALELDGGTWVPATLPADFVWGVWGVAGTPWAASSGALYRREGTNWVDAGTPAFQPRDIAGTGPDDVWVTGAAGAMQHSDGSGWVRLDLPTANETAQRLTTVSPSSTWAITTDPTHSFIDAWDGSAWAPIWSGTNADPPRGIWASASGGLWATTGSAVLRYDGATWNPVPMPAGWSAGGASPAWVVGTSADNVFVTLTTGHVLHWSGSAFADEDPGVWRLISATVLADGTVIAVTPTAIIRRAP